MVLGGFASHVWSYPCGQGHRKVDQLSLLKRNSCLGSWSMVSAGRAAWTAVVTASEHTQGGCLAGDRDDVREETEPVGEKGQGRARNEESGRLIYPSLSPPSQVILYFKLNVNRA